MKAALFPGSPTPNPFRPDEILSEAAGACLQLQWKLNQVFYIPAVNNLKFIN